MVMWFASGNRDEASSTTRTASTSPGPTRPRHVRQGQPAYCLGNMLARTEIRLMFTELLPRLTAHRAHRRRPRVRSNFVNGIKKLPVRASVA